MIVQVFLLFTCVNIFQCKDTDSHEAKYIDLLPEEEKQDFLNRIAQRILAEIKGRDRSDATSVEISDERLDEHNAYVQRIMEEETENLKHKRRLGSQSKGDDVDKDAASESRGKSLDTENVLGQDNTDLTVLKNNIRIKKDTNEDMKQTSIENRRINSEDKFSEVPVPILYDEGTSYNIVTDKNVFDNDDPTNEQSVETNLKVEGLLKRSDTSENSEGSQNHNEPSDFQFQNKDFSYMDYDGTRVEVTTDVPRTLIDDFDPEEIPKESAVITTPRDIKIKSKDFTSSSTEKILDLSNVKSFLLNVKSTNSFTSTTSKNNKEKISPSKINDTLELTSRDHTTYGLRSILRSEMNSSEPNIEMFTVNGTDNLESIFTTHELGINFSTDSTNKDGDEILLTTSDVAQENTSHIRTENIVQREGNSSDDGSDPKQSLRYGERGNVESTITAKYPLNTNILKASTENYKSYQDFEVSNKKSPFVPSEQVNTGSVEEPHYVPVYNYEPSNAFYTGYNYFGPNYGENDETNEIQTNYNRVYKKINKQNIKPDYTEAKTQNKKGFQPRGNFKFYDNNGFKPRSVAALHQNHLSPAWKGGFSDISFNPNDYLDLDYYPGRNEDAPDTDEDVHVIQNFLPQELRQGESVDVVDPDASLEHYNVKDNIAALRNALFVHKYGKKTKIFDIINKNSQLKTKWKQNVDPILRGLDDTFLIFLSGGKAGGKANQGTYDDKNIAVDYYFSRMNSEEQPLSEPLSNETYKPIPKRLTSAAKSRLKNTHTMLFKDKIDKVINETHLQIPLEPDNVLRIDLAVKNGNKVNIIFRNVKKSEPDQFEAHLNSFIIVIQDMIENDDKGLQRYHWLASTVDIQSAIDKLLQLTKALQAQDELHYSDFELIKYILYVFQTANKLIKDAEDPRSRNEGNVKTPRAAGSRAEADMEQPLNTLRKIYKDIQELQEMSVTMSDTALLEFDNFLLDLQSSLNKLHEAVKEIATITNYKQQNWFNDLKRLHLSPVDRDVSLSLLLHLATSKLFGVVEDGAKNGLEDNFIIFVQNHREEVARTREDFVFVLKLLKAIKKNVDS